MPASNSTTRFSDRVEDYIRYRPRYPVAALDLLAAECGLSPDSVIADIGSGTGILSELFLENGNSVIGVEPNRQMRAAAEELLAGYARFQSVDGRAEASRLPGECADFVTAAQAFHWFDVEPAAREFRRILRPEGYAVILFNDRRTVGDDFAVAYEALLRGLQGDYASIDHKNVSDETMLRFFGGKLKKARFDNLQTFDLPGLIGRAASASYFPARGSPAFAAAVADLTDLFSRYAAGGKVRFEYDCLMYYGHLL